MKDRVQGLSSKCPNGGPVSVVANCCSSLTNLSWQWQMERGAHFQDTLRRNCEIASKAKQKKHGVKNSANFSIKVFIGKKELEKFLY